MREIHLIYPLIFGYHSAIIYNEINLCVINDGYSSFIESRRRYRMNKNQYQWYDHVKFIIPSIIGIFLFMSPVKTADGFTIPIAILANWIEELLAKQLSAIMVIIIVQIGRASCRERV